MKCHKIEMEIYLYNTITFPSSNMTSSIQSFYNTRNNSMKSSNRNITTELFENDKTYSLRQKMTSNEVAQQLRKSERSLRKETRRSIVENKVIGSFKRPRHNVDYYESDQEDDTSDGDYNENMDLNAETTDTLEDSDSDYEPESDEE